MPTFISDEAYDRLIAALDDILTCPPTGDRTAKINEVLCMLGNVWPESVRADIAANQNERLSYSLANFSARS